MTFRTAGKIPTLGRSRRIRVLGAAKPAKSSGAGQRGRDAAPNPVLQKQTRGGPVVVLPSSSAETGDLRRALRPAFEGKS